MTENAPIPKHGWLLHSTMTGEYLQVGPSLDSLASCTEGIYNRTKAQFPDCDPIILCYELGRMMTVTLRPVIARLAPTEEDEGSST